MAEAEVARTYIPRRSRGMYGSRAEDETISSHNARGQGGYLTTASWHASVRAPRLTACTSAAAQVRGRAAAAVVPRNCISVWEVTLSGCCPLGLPLGLPPCPQPASAELALMCTSECKCPLDGSSRPTPFILSLLQALPHHVCGEGSLPILDCSGF
ncbi:hypothetical protein HaLaN_18294 [Haematococcus lacustris]|uniref:Uncharacterized protein n=1 Tax=Haematococcus lacustris TaxID=44745 RepID=A0A699ZFS5_HAELA|nr:hypothetical protein HaLaN_18294 [Haematococcus lacustris]